MEPENLPEINYNLTYDISVYTKYFIQINTVMQITEIIKPEYVEKSIPGISSKRYIKKYHDEKFMGTEREWEREIRARVPGGFFIPDSEIRQSTYIQGGEVVGHWHDGQGTLPKKGTVIGSGAYAVVQQTQDPFMVRKKYKYPITDKESYLNYINTIRNMINRNPYFPRVYKVVMQKSAEKQRPTYELEKLHKLSETSFEVLEYLLLRYFPGKTTKKEIAQIKNTQLINFHKPSSAASLFAKKMDELTRIVLTTIKLRPIDQNNIGDFISDLVTVMQQKMKNVEPELVEALVVIASLVMVEPKNRGIDMSSANFMVRLSPYPQIVFTDPLS